MRTCGIFHGHYAKKPLFSACKTPALRLADYTVTEAGFGSDPGEIITMPGLPKVPNAEAIKPVNGKTTGLF